LEVLPQETFVGVSETLSAAGWLTDVAAVLVQLLASVTVTLYAPTDKPVRPALVTPLLQTYENAPVPPDTDDVMTPLLLLPPLALLQDTFVADNETLTCAGWPTVAEPVAEQLLASATVTE
jgi:hypothetical protein